MSYDEITNLEDISRKAISKIPNESYLVNFDLKVKFNRNLVNTSIRDVELLAKDFQELKCPKTLYMNHGEYINKKTDGIQNVINELKKEKSNRSLISLINQEDIIDSKDKPIPSFMILQFSIEEGTKLYVTTYFRALEVATFLRVNIEEIRLILKRILNSYLAVEEIYLNIIAFRAYNKPERISLIKPKIDLFGESEILKHLMKDEFNKLIPLLDEKKYVSTVIEYQSLEYIIKLINDEVFKKFIHENLQKPLVSVILKEAVVILKELKELRQRASHHSSIDDKEKEFKEKIEKLIREIRNEPS